MLLLTADEGGMDMEHKQTSGELNSQNETALSEMVRMGLLSVDDR